MSKYDIPDASSFKSSWNSYPVDQIMLLNNPVTIHSWQLYDFLFWSYIFVYIFTFVHMIKLTDNSILIHTCQHLSPVQLEGNMNNLFSHIFITFTFQYWSNLISLWPKIGYQQKQNSNLRMICLAIGFLLGTMNPWWWLSWLIDWLSECFYRTVLHRNMQTYMHRNSRI